MRKALNSRRRAGRRGERGLTLVEVLVSFFILFVVTLAVLQLLSMAYAVNLGAITRTELMYKAQQVVETLRLQRFRFSPAMGLSPTALETACCPYTANRSMTISTTDATYAANNCDQFWGPQRINLLDSSARFSLSYYIDPNGKVTVQGVPQTAGANLYRGPAATKVVTYVAQLP